MLLTPSLLDRGASIQKYDEVKHETETVKISKSSERLGFKTEVFWKNVLLFIFFHVAAIYGLYLMLFVGTWKTFVWSLFLVLISNVGITAGSHRLWSHKTYKAKLPLRIILMVCQSMAFQKSIHEWVRDHRVHHKYTHTDADPHNPERGFFFAHIGWLMMKKHKEVLTKGNGIDLSDVETDPVVKFQKRFYTELVILTCFIFPAMVPWYFWGENLWVCWYTPTFFRFVCTLNITLLVNSLAHAWGTRPYDISMGPADNAFISFLSSGEGWHNFHHVFPWDYKAGEFGSYGLNFTTKLIDFFSILGWAYDLKSASVEMVNNRKRRTGANYSYTWKSHEPQDGVWGWGDNDMGSEEVERIKVYNRLRQ